MTLSPTFLGVAAVGLVGIAASIPFIPDLLRRVLAPESTGWSSERALQGRPPRLSIPLLTTLAVVQAAVLVVACAWVGTQTRFSAAPWTHLRIASANVPVMVAFGAVAGFFGALSISGGGEPLIEYLRSTPLGVRLLYGGLTEEVIVRWGLLSAILWGLAHLGEHRAGPRGFTLIWSGIFLTTAVFATGHVPLLRRVIPTAWRRATALIFAVSLLWGWLAVVFGLVSAVAAHATFHAVIEALARNEN